VTSGAAVVMRLPSAAPASAVPANCALILIVYPITPMSATRPHAARGKRHGRPVSLSTSRIVTALMTMRIPTSVTGGMTFNTTLEMTYMPPQMLEATTAARMPF
jgi:hypothetical protein